MRIGRRPEAGMIAEIGKWYIGADILMRPPYKIRGFQPYLFVWCVKFLTDGFEDRVGGKPADRVGGWRHYSFPWHIYFSIERS